MSISETITSKRNPPWNRDELIVALDYYVSVNGSPPEADSKEIAILSSKIRSINSSLLGTMNPTFRNNNGVYMKLMNFKAVESALSGKITQGLPNGSKLDRLVFTEFINNHDRLKRLSDSILSVSSRYGSLPSLNNDIECECPEGQLLMRMHLTRERSPSLVRKLKAQKANIGALNCEICGFDFAVFYGSIGHGFIECHHNFPLYKYSEIHNTKLADLSLVCSNCHRMLHKHSDLTINDLKLKISSSNPAS